MKVDIFPAKEFQLCHRSFPQTPSKITPRGVLSSSLNHSREGQGRSSAGGQRVRQTIKALSSPAGSLKHASQSKIIRSLSTIFNRTLIRRFTLCNLNVPIPPFLFSLIFYCHSDLEPSVPPRFFMAPCKSATRRFSFQGSSCIFFKSPYRLKRSLENVQI